MTACPQDAPWARPKVRLVNAFAQPFNNAVATARTCYASRVITEADVSQSEPARAQRDAIARSTYAAGHHTTLQHATYQFVIENVSRQFIWSFLHAHPHYNSEQVSQRYVTVRPDRVRVPSLPASAEALYLQTVRAQMDTYQRLCTLLAPRATEAYFRIFPARRKAADAHRGAIRKKAQEIARYVLPIGTFAHLYHTLSGLTLHRYRRLRQSMEVPTETAEVVDAMVAAAAAHDPLFFRDAEDPLELTQTPEYAALAQLGACPRGAAEARAFVAAFDAELGGRSSVLIDYSARAEATLAWAVRSTLGLLPSQLDDAAAIALVLSPAHSQTLGGAINLKAHSKLFGALSQVSYVFAKKLSHSADSQDQRHRTTPGARPLLQQHYVPGAPDVIVPPLVRDVPEALDLFMRSVTDAYRAIDTLRERGIDAEHALYLLPNAVAVRFVQGGNLAGLHHKWTTRLCYNAQEEIWRASLDEVQAVAAIHPRIAAHLLPPCGLRHAAGLRPVCPEGPRFCGVKVWQQNPADYVRVL